ncbi:MAG TPA: DUF4013 domain-containing protein [Thermoanaerobaculia bacterium]|jgi:hypothetical protein
MSELSYPPPPPPPPPPPAAAPASEFDFAKPFTYVFEDPRWLTKILIGGLFYLAMFFIVGAFFILGYLARLTRNVIAGERYPLPEWDDLGEFFAEGARLIVVGILWMLPFFALVAMIVVPAIAAGATNNDALKLFSTGLSGCVALLIVVFSLAMMVIMPASLLFAMVEQRIGAAFEFGRIWRFIRANVGNYLMAVVVYLIARFIGGFGVALLCIGVIFTAFWSFLITAYGFAQAYRLSLRR